MTSTDDAANTPAIFAKSSQGSQRAELLVDHLIAVRSAARALRQRVGTMPACAEAGPAAGFWPTAEAAALCHDLGKVADGFQSMLAGRTRSWGQRHEVLSLGFLPAVIGDDDLRRWIGSAVVTHHRPLTAPPGSPARAIAVQYGGLTAEDLAEEFGAVRDEAVAALHHWLCGAMSALGLATADGQAAPTGAAIVAAASAELQALHWYWDEPTDPATGLVAVLLQGAVTLADHLASAAGTLHSRQPVGAGFPARLARRIGGPDRFHQHQRDCLDVQGHLLLRSPTGSGKTEAGLLWAARQVEAVAAETGGTPRVFLTLPYLASINAMADRLGDLLGDRELVGVAHSRAASYHLSTAVTDDGPGGLDAGSGGLGGAGTGASGLGGVGTGPDGPCASGTGPGGDAARRAAASKAVSRAAATRLFRETVRVATPYQLLRAALAGPAHSSILVDCANSVIVLDELHAYDASRLGYILASANLLERLGCRIAVLSATLPTALADLVGQAMRQPVTTIVGPPGRSRHRIGMRRHQLTDQASLDEIAERLRAGQSVLVVANNVAHAQALFESLAPIASEQVAATGEVTDDAAVLLHSRFTRGDRSAIEARLARRYASGAEPRRPGLVVATQVVEVSLDIDLDVLYTAGAPLEALLQRFGRVNRRGARPPADVVVCQPGYGPRRGGGDARYADGIYPAEPVEHGLDILARHDGQPVDETEATGWLDEIYSSPWGVRWRDEVNRARLAFEQRFLTFLDPYEARDELEAVFDQQFDGTEAILAADRDAYVAALDGGPWRGPGSGARPTAADRLLGEQYLIPLPHWATMQAAYDKRLRVAIIDGDYDPERGLLAVRPVRGTVVYQPGEVL